MIQLTESLGEFLIKNYPKVYVMIWFGHIEYLTDEIRKEYLKSLEED